ncbi:MAG: histidine utilization repressor [Sneathiella sp.]|jgi:GntR family histidine utilization transcriptional repressor|uniref:UTRA domain-containing protein n=1 Tax=Sneathiella sp. TaxID=1964365 RepID=UPI000C59B777|nr:UTRA domain-containing protein [Sneathiella sp.]MAL78996.1 histidine utilization repressor [Sneathiella sp.]|tara:strand:- start:740 stop:1468 length:729 start_codon:yes stop_codon:yes gene_type:complete
MPHITQAQDDRGYAPPKPLYEQVKSYVLENIESGEWPAYFQIPSEHMLVREMGISRMTIHRALRELTQAGYLERIQGVGTFVAAPKKQPKILEIREIDDIIRDRGGRHQCDIHFLQGEQIEHKAATLMAMKPGDEVFRSYVVHREDGLPVMLEDRYVNPRLVADFLEADFSRMTADTFLARKYALLSHSHAIQAAVSNAEINHFLELEAITACLVINRKSWLGNEIISAARLVLPGNRIQLG